MASFETGYPISIHFTESLLQRIDNICVAGHPDSYSWHCPYS